ncbi:MAG TPA: AMP-binding protein [Candidatus Limnocylindrales bacterium]|nr:AMP-binding protein [Candidatus Limnocylindrales bacterium]
MSTSAIVAAVRQAAEKFPEKVALIAGEQQVSYSELIRRAQSAGAHIAKQAEGENVGIFLPNSLDFAPSFLGALWAGKTVAVLPTLAPALLLKFMFAEARLTTIFTSADLAPKLAEAGVPHVVIDIEYPTMSDFALQPRGHDTAVLLYTSGTTGRPKTVALSERNIISNAEGCRRATGFDDRQVMLAILPLFHAYGLTVTILLPLMSGSTVVISERFVPRTVLNLIERHRVTTIVAVPSQYRVLAMDPTPCDASSLWLCIAGAERLPDTTEREFTTRFGHAVLPGYGATELSPVVSLNIPETNRPASVGKPLTGTTVTIRNDDSSVCPVGEVGEICVEGPNVMLGYLNDPEGTARKIRNGVLYTGDKGFFDADGYLYISGRADEMVKVAGEKIYPVEIENALERIAGVEEVAVVALHDPRGGVRLHAFVQRKPGAALDETSLRLACREVLEPYKIPRTFTFVDSLPRTMTGKTDKRTLATSAPE